MDQPAEDLNRGNLYRRGRIRSQDRPRLLHFGHVGGSARFFPGKHVRGLPRYDLALILLARLAVDYRFAGKGLGQQLFGEAFRISIAVSELAGCRCIITDAYRDKVSWYAKYGFIPLEGGSENQPTQRMFLDIRTLKAALQRPHHGWAQ